jgi:hypothetical protein
MTFIPVSPATVQFGDRVLVNNEVLHVKSFMGPDSNGTYDFYLANQEKEIHSVVTDSITLVR